MCENSLKRRSAVRSRTLCTATKKGYLTSFKKTTNPNVSPIGERFGFECFGAGVLNQPKISHLKSGGWLTYFLVHLPTLCLFVMMIAQDFMEKYKYNESNGLWYELQGDYYLPCLQLPEEKQVHIGIWGQRHLNYLRENKRVLLSGLQLSGKLNSYLADIDKQAEEMCSRLVKQMAEREGVSETLKAEDQMEWIQRINSIKNRAIEIVNTGIIFV